MAGLAAKGVVLGSKDVQGAGERVGCLLVLITLAAQVSEPAVQVSDLLTERGLAGGDAVLAGRSATLRPQAPWECISGSSHH